MTTRVDVVVPGAEGRWIARALREGGYDVREADDSHGSSDADVVVIARSIPGFEDAIAELDTRVLVVSWDPVSDEQASTWGVFAVLTRPVPVSKLLAAIARELPGTTSSILQRATLPAPPSSSDEDDEDDVPPIIVREPTVHLDPPPRVPTIHLDDPPPTTGISIVSQDTARDSQVVASTTASGTGRLFTEASAQFSPQLSGMLRDADRRIFPNDPPLDVRFPGGDESAEELVPDALLAEVAIPLDLADADPLEAFTFVGTPDLVHAGVATTGSVSSVVEEHTPRTVPERLASSSPTVTGSDLAREGMLPPAGAIRVLWQAHDGSEPVRLRFDVAGGPRVELVIAHDQVVAFEGPAHLEVARVLREEGRARREPTGEDEAKAALEDDVRDGALNRYELERRLREARERLIADLLVAPELRFVSQPAGSVPSRRLLSRSLMSFVCERARRSVSIEECLRWLTLDANAKLELEDVFERRAGEAGVEPEVVRLFEDAAGHAIGSLFAGTHASAGLAGVVLTLASADALRFDGEADDFDRRADEARDHILAVHALAEEGTYFELLGVRPDATSRDIEHAHQRRTRELASLDLAFLALEDLADLRREALIALDEAAAILANSRLRQAYAEALTPLQT